MEALTNQVSGIHLVTAIPAYLVTLALYRLFFHPLARFPGPRLAAITRWYEMYYDVVHNGQYTFKIKEMHRQYGISISLPPMLPVLHSNYEPYCMMQVLLCESALTSYTFTMQPFTTNSIVKMGIGINTLGRLMLLPTMVRALRRRITAFIRSVANP